MSKAKNNDLDQVIEQIKKKTKDPDAIMRLVVDACTPNPVVHLTPNSNPVLVSASSKVAMELSTM